MQTEITDSTLQSLDLPPMLRDDADTMSQLLYKELRALCIEGEPLNIIKNLVSGHRGAEAWRRLAQRYQLRGKAPQTAIEEELLGLKWPTDEDDIPGFFDQMEALEEEYNKIAGDKEPPYPRSTMKAIATRVLPKKMKEDVRSDEKKFQTYEDIRDYVLRMSIHAREDQGRNAAAAATKKKERDTLLAVKEQAKAEGFQDGDRRCHPCRGIVVAAPRQLR